MKILIQKIVSLFAPKPEPVPCPWEQKGTRRTAQKGTMPPPNVVYHAGRAFTQQEVDRNVYEDTRILTGSGRSAVIGTRERDTIPAKSLDTAKYAELKALWAAGQSAASVAAMYKGRRGYGIRTLETYWSAFNSVGQDDTEY
jgi:hypothetical protein